jgi:replicative DNA helicase
MSLPNSPEAERAAIGCALADSSLAAELRADWFFDQRYRLLAEIIIAFASQGKPVDTVTITEAGRERGLADACLLVGECADASPSPASWPYWRDRLGEALTLRSIVNVAQESIQSVREADKKPVDLLDEFETKALAIRQQATGANMGEVDIRAALREQIGEWEDCQRNGRPAGLATGFADLDRLLGGLRPQQLFIIAARPSVGKTALALGIAERLAVLGSIPVGFFSLEMSARELLVRMMCSIGRLNPERLNRGEPTEQDFRSATVGQSKVARAPLAICDQGGLTIAQLAARARRMKQGRGIKLLIVDYLGLLRSGEKNRSRYEEVTAVSSGLKMIAKQLDIPVIALAQLNRDSDKEDRQPKLTDLRDSGSIEQDADIVGMLHRDEKSTADAQAVRLIIGKHRNGRTGSVNLVFLRGFTRFENAADAQGCSVSRCSDD